MQLEILTDRQMDTDGQIDRDTCVDRQTIDMQILDTR